MSSQRYRLLRYKLDDLTKGIHKITLYKHYLRKTASLCEKTVIASDSCIDGKIYLKYLASDGLYKFILFDRGVNLLQNTNEGSRSYNIPYSTTDMTGSTKELGYSKTRMITASVNVDIDKYRILESIQDSPRVYVQINDKTFTPEDTEKNWVMCNVQMNSNNFPVKKGRALISITITMPEVFSVSSF